MAQNTSTRSALVDAFLNSPWTDFPGPDAMFGVDISPMITGLRAIRGGLQQRRPYHSPPPPRPPRPFSEDYPSSYFDPLLQRYRRMTDTKGKLLYDSERRRLGAEYVVGRRYRDGPDVGLQPDEVTDVIEKLMGGDLRFLPQDQMPKSRSGNPLFGVTSPFQRPWWLGGQWRPGTISIDANLDPRSQDLVARHELGHVVGLLAELSTNEIRSELRTLFNTMNNRNRTQDGLNAAPGYEATPESLGYKVRPSDPLNVVEHEYIAEAIRAYMTDPNFVKTVAPNAAAAIRRAVNSNPRINRVIQFNSLKFPTYAGFESRGQAQTEVS